MPERRRCRSLLPAYDSQITHGGVAGLVLGGAFNTHIKALARPPFGVSLDSPTLLASKQCHTEHAHARRVRCYGRYRSARINSVRSINRSNAFNWRKVTVVRPSGVSPTMRAPSSSK